MSRRKTETQGRPGVHRGATRLPVLLALALVLLESFVPARSYGEDYREEIFKEPAQPVTPVCVFSVYEFSNQLIYMSGFAGAVEATKTWPGEMGWQGDRIDIEFVLGDDVPANTVHHEFSINITDQFVQEFDVAIRVGQALDELVEVHREYVDSPRTLVALIPTRCFEAGQTNWIRIQGIDVQVGFGEAPGIRWDGWALQTIFKGVDIDAVRNDLIARLAEYIFDAVQPSGLVRDSLTLSPSDAPFHPATPDAAGFALLGVCALDHLGVIENAEETAQFIIESHAGHTPGVKPERTADGHWRHFMDVETGAFAGGGWEPAFTTIGSALLVTGAQFARNHFATNAEIAALAEEVTATTSFDAAIMSDPVVDGRIYLSMLEEGGGDDTFGYASPWNEFMLVVSLALREPDNQSALQAAELWLTSSNLPTIAYEGIETLTDDPMAFAPAFWVQQMHFFNADFVTNAGFETFFENQQLADQMYSASVLRQEYRYGLTAGVVPGGYHADRIGDHNCVFSPEAVAAWGDLQNLAKFYKDQSPRCDPRHRYGLVRVSTKQPSWIPFDTGLVDHLFLLFGLVESIEPLFFIQRLPGQIDADGDGIADRFDNCPLVSNPTQADCNADGTGDACVNPGDFNGDGIVDLTDFGDFTDCFGGPGVPPTPNEPMCADACLLAYDFDDDADVDLRDFGSFQSVFAPP